MSNGGLIAMLVLVFVAGMFVGAVLAAVVGSGETKP
jgi:hypothetical protein